MTRGGIRGPALLSGVLLGAGGGTASLEAQTSPGHSAGTLPSAAAHAVEVAPVIDGRLDEASWLEAEPVTGFVQHDPAEGAPATERTEVRILYDREALYVGAWLFDSDPSGIILGDQRRDADLEEGDAFLILLDTYHDRQNAFVFGTNPTGIEFDGQVAQDGLGRGGSPDGPAGSGGAFNLQWDGDWEVATSRDERGWYVEMRIPFSTIRYGSGDDQAWGFNAARYIRRRSEQSFWAPVPRQYNFFRVSMAGELTGLDVPVDRPVFLTPYVRGTAERRYLFASEVEYPYEFGADLKMEVSSTLTMDLTYNTDFAQVEVDEERIDLSRFNVFFPEKRPFFLENASIFSVGDPGFAEVFHSRRIGIGRDGRPIPIRGGGRVTGMLGSQEIGLLHIRTEEVPGEMPANAYSVARISRSLPSRSRIGGILTARIGQGDGDHNHAYAIDGRWGIGPNLTLDGYAATTRTPGLDGRRHNAYLNLDYSGTAWQSRAEYMELGDDYNPELGFIRRSGFRVGTFFLQRRILVPSVSWLREVRPSSWTIGFFDFDGFEESSTMRLRSAFVFESGAQVTPAFIRSREGLQEPFEIAPGVVLPPGTYDNLRTTWQFNTDESAPLSLRGQFETGGFMSGTRTGGNLTLSARRGGSLTTGLRTVYNRVALEEGDFTTTLVGLRIRYAFSPRMFVQSLVQYSDQAEVWSSNVRFAWLSAANTGLFLVFNDSQRTGDLSGPTHREFTVKYSRQLGGWSLPGAGDSW